MDILQRRRELLFLILIYSLEFAHGIHSKDFVSYGDGDTTLKSNGGFVEIDLSPSGILFYGSKYSKFFITPDSQLVAENTFYVPGSFQISKVPQITAMKSNMDSSGVSDGTIYYRLVTSGDLLKEVSRNVSKLTADAKVFSADLVVVVTYHNVATKDNSERNTFQIVLASRDAVELYAIFNYEKIGVQTYGNHGFVKGDGTVYQKHPTTPSDLPTSTNVCIEGQYIYKIDGDTIGDPENCVVSKPCVHGTCCVDGEARCVCNDGWMGDQCSEYDKCFFKGCQNGQCNIDGGTGNAKCDCDNGFIGDLCDIDICESLPCDNGRCLWATDTAFCDCEFGWSGSDCSVDVCEQRNCQNQGVCSLISRTEATCKCQPGYLGVECEKNICDITTCEDNAKCDSTTGECVCGDGWTGIVCDIALCDPHKCIHGQCEGVGDEVECICQKGWTGDQCNKDEDECATTSSPCLHGKCINDFGSYRCLCNNGFVGESCDKPDQETLQTLVLLGILGLII